MIFTIFVKFITCTSDINNNNNNNNNDTLRFKNEEALPSDTFKFIP